MEEEEKTVGAEPAAPTSGFTVGKWGTFPRWACERCPFDTLDGEAAIRDHLAERHAPPATRVPISVPILDRFGNQIGTREV